jgi:hypothetical protein
MAARDQMNNSERTELIAALHELVTFAEDHERWVGQLGEFRKRLAGLMIEPPPRPQ